MADLNYKEIKRKAELGIPLTNPTFVAMKAYERYQREANSSGGTNAPKAEVAYTNTQPAAVVQPTAQDGRAKREAEKAMFTGWDNNPAVRALQEASWDIYIDTGSWNSPEQKELHKQAEKARMYDNPMYGGSPAGPTDWMDAEKITPRDTTPGANTVEGAIDSALNPDNYGSYLKAGAGLVFVMFIMSMFRR